MDRLIISRKGFDSGRGNGRCASPIFPDGTMFSLPIPSRSGEPLTFYGDLRHGDVNIGDVVEDLTHGRVTRDCIAHFGPDINRAALRQRHPDWRGLLGQSGSAQGLLRSKVCGAGRPLPVLRLVIRPVEESDGHWRHVPGSPDLHVLWGWLSIGDIRKVDDIPDDDPLVDWALRHPDMVGGDSTNTIYVADDGLGSGVFPRFNERLQLTNPGDTRSRWRLPRWFYPFDPGGERPALGYHGNASRWRPEGDDVLLATVGRGQEFVLDATAYPEAVTWALSVIEPS